MIIKTSIIKKLSSGEYRLYSRKKDQSGIRRRLGTHDSLLDAKAHEEQIQYFKQGDLIYPQTKHTVAIRLDTNVFRVLS